MTTESEMRTALATSRTIAVIGAHTLPHKPAHYVPAYLAEVGYRVIPVNPAFVGRTLFGEPVRARLADIQEPVDLVDVFRRSERVPVHLDDILAMTPLPRFVWLQLGIENDDVAAALAARGIAVIQDACTLAEHRRLGIGRIGGVGRP